MVETPAGSRRPRTLVVDGLRATTMVVVAGAEAHHARNVLRLKPGDAVRLIDGRGCRAAAVVETVERHQLTCRVETVAAVPPPVAARLEVVVACPKGGRFDDMVRALTELGVGRIAPLRCRRSGREPSPERAARVALEAVKQCGRADCPVIAPLSDIATCLASDRRTIMLDPQGLAPRPGPPQDTRLIIGPEGGFTADEHAQLVAGGAEPVRVADTVLRIETAAVAAAAIWANTWEHHD